MEEEREEGATTETNTDPYRDDPIFGTKREMKNYFQGSTSSDDSSDNSEETNSGIDQSSFTNEPCRCGKCCDVESSKGVQHHCCQKVIDLWISKVDPSESDLVKCITETKAFEASINQHAIRNYLLLIWKEQKKGKYKKSDCTPLQDPTTNANMRFGCYYAGYQIHGFD